MMIAGSVPAGSGDWGEGALSETATSVRVTEDAAGTVAMISGSNRPEAAGHRFGPDLTCIECGKTWETHQVEPTVCTPRPEFAAQYQATLKDDL